MEEKIKKIEVSYMALKVIGEKCLNEYGLLMLKVLEEIFEEEKTPSSEDEV